MKKNSTLELTSEELFFLAALMGSTSVFGLADPYQGELVETIEDRWTAIKSGLIEKGMISEGNEGLEFNPSIMSFLGSIFYPNKVSWVKVSDISSHTEYDAYLYFTLDSVKEKTTKNENGIEVHLIRSLGTPEEMFQQLIEKLALTDLQQQDSYESIKLSHEKFQGLLTVSRTKKQEDIDTYLKDLGVSGDVLQILADILLNKTLEAQILTFRVENDEWQTGNVGIIKGLINGLLVKDLSQEVELSIQGKTEIEKAVKYIFKDFVSLNQEV